MSAIVYAESESRDPVGVLQPISRDESNAVCAYILSAEKPIKHVPSERDQQHEQTDQIEYHQQDHNQEQKTVIHGLCLADPETVDAVCEIASEMIRAAGCVLAADHVRIPIAVQDSNGIARVG